MGTVSWPGVMIRRLFKSGRATLDTTPFRRKPHSMSDEMNDATYVAPATSVLTTSANSRRLSGATAAEASAQAERVMQAFRAAPMDAAARWMQPHSRRCTRSVCRPPSLPRIRQNSWSTTVCCGQLPHASKWCSLVWTTQPPVKYCRIICTGIPCSCMAQTPCRPTSRLSSRTSAPCYLRTMPCTVCWTA